MQKRQSFIMLTVVILSPFFVFAEDELKSYRDLEGDLERKKQPTEEEKRFLEASERFDPWYSGPLITGGPSNLAAGVYSITPYEFLFTTNYALWDENRRTQNMTDRFVFSGSTTFQAGITNWLDTTLILQGAANWQGNKSSGGFGDMTVGIGIQILSEGLYQPAIRFVFNETFPTGKYQHLRGRLEGLDATGLGSYQSQFGLRIGKLILWDTQHPIYLRGAYSISVLTDVHVKGFNSYGGGKKTNGTVRPGYAQQANAAIEWSLTQNWALALDLVYNWSARTTFKGFPGVSETTFDNGGDPIDSIRFEGEAPSVGVGSNDQFSLAPAIEFIPTASVNFLLGVWFNVYGRNVPQFVAVGTNMSYTF